MDPSRVAGRIGRWILIAVLGILAGPGTGVEPALGRAPHDLFDPAVEFVFEHVTVDDGLPNNTVRAILQDRSGFMWFGTQNGLARFDGHRMEVFSPDPGDSLGFGGRTVTDLYESRDGRIWIGTMLTGLWVLDPDTGVFGRVDLTDRPEPDQFGIADLVEDPEGRLWVCTQIGVVRHDPADGTNAWQDRIRFADVADPVSGPSVVCRDRRGRFWFGSWRDGVKVYDPASGEVATYRHDADAKGSLPGDSVNCIVEDDAGRLWFATNAGLCQWRETTRDFRVFTMPALDSPQANAIYHLAPDGDDLLWVGSAAGLYLFSARDGEFRLFSHAGDRPRSLAAGHVISVAIDRSRQLWAGIWHNGLDKLDLASGRFRTIPLPGGEEEGGYLEVEAVLTNGAGDLVVGTSDQPRGSGRGQVFLREADSDGFRELPVSGSARPLGSVTALAEGLDDRIWLGTVRGLRLMEDGGVRLPALEGPGAASLSGETIMGLAVDSAAHLWIVTFETVYRLDLADGWVERTWQLPSGEGAIRSSYLTAIHVDAHDRVWVGTDGQGLFLFDQEGRSTQRFFDAERGIEAVTGFLEDDQGLLWLATYSGLVRFDPATGDARLISRHDGLPNDTVATVVGDRQGRIWMSTGLGFALYDPGQDTIRLFDVRDGLPSNRVHHGGVLGRDGLVYFGGEGSVVDWNPDEFAPSRFEPDVMLTSVRVGGEPLGLPAQIPASGDDGADVSVFPHDRNDFGFTFVAFDFGRPERNLYRYRLEGEDDGWREPGGEPRAEYTNLGPGSYRFRVQGSNRDGVWSPREAVFAFRIAPPWWRTGVATAAYVLATLLLAWVLFRQLTMRERMRAEINLQKAEAEHLQHLDGLKTRFLTNITHEFRTPLTLLKVPLQDLCREDPTGDPDPGRAAAMLRNAERLEHLIDQLLDLSRLEAGRLPLRWQLEDWSDYVGRFAAGFESLATRRGVEFILPDPATSVRAWFDADICEKLVGNLLTNAFKHTPEGGRIRLRVEVEPEFEMVPPVRKRDRAPDAPLPARMLRIDVENSGSFVAPEERRRIFDRFYQAEDVGGSGVGLSLVRELVDWLGGEAEVASDATEGTCFTIRVPVFLADPVAADPAAGIVDEPGPEPDEAAAPVEEGQPRVLIVEDEADMRDLIASYLAPDYDLLQAVDGVEGLEMALAEIPDLVLSDVMMPRMDGFELCAKLKADERTSHVPVVLLTALAEAESKHSGLRQGADDYLAKPFDTEELRLRVANLIAQRKLLKERFERSQGVMVPGTIEVTSADEKFVTRLRGIIDANLEESDFKAQNLCDEIGMSRSQLHRKTQAVTGMSVTTFVRTHRLQRAAQLFDGGYGNVTEVAFAVGFQNLSYFARSFRELYGVQPREYLKSREEADRRRQEDA